MPDHEDNLILDLATEAGAMLVSNDTDLLANVCMARDTNPDAYRLPKFGRCHTAPHPAKATLRQAVRIRQGIRHHVTVAD